MILNDDLAHNWLSYDLNTDDIKEVIHTEYPESCLENYAVSKYLLSPKVDSNIEAIINKVEYTELDL